MEQYHELKTEIELVKKDVVSMTGIIEKLDVAIDKIGEVASSLNRMLAIHETKIGMAEKNDSELYQMLEEAKKENDKDYHLLDSRIQESHEILLGEIKELKNEMKNHHELVSDRLTKLEHWRWLIIGGAVVVGFIISKVPFSLLLQ
jgi:Fe2+ transport system protein B